MGFQDVPRIVRQAAGRKGGRVKTKKGLGGNISPKKKRQIQSMGGKNNRYANNRSGEASRSPQDDQGGGLSDVADILGALDE